MRGVLLGTTRFLKEEPLANTPNVRRRHSRGELLGLAAKKNACQDVALQGVRALLKVDSLGFVFLPSAAAAAAVPAPDNAAEAAR